MEMDRINIIFGWFWLLVGLLLGAYLQYRVGTPEWMNSFQRMFWKAFHIHASMLAIINVIYGYALEKVHLGDGLKITGEILLILGTIIFSGALFLAGIKQEWVKLAFPGTWVIILAIIILLFGLLKRPKAAL